MKRFVWGIILLAVGGLALLGSANAPRPSQSIASAVSFLVGGAVLTHYGWRKLQRQRVVANEALLLLQESGYISGDLLASRSGLSEYKARLLLIAEMKKGNVPFQAEIR